MTETRIPRMRTILECAEETGVSATTIRKLIWKHEIVFIKCGNKYLVNLDRFIDYLNGEPITKEGNVYNYENEFKA